MPSSRRLLGLGLAAMICAAAVPLGAEEVSVPVRLQAALLSKVAAYDRNLATRAQSGLKTLIVLQARNADSERVADELMTELGALPVIANFPHTEERMVFSNAAALASACRQKHVSIVFLTPGLSKDARAIASALSGVDVLSVSAMPEYVEQRIVLGFELKSGKPKLVVHLGQARAQNVAFKPELLSLARVLE